MSRLFTTKGYGLVFGSLNRATHVCDEIGLGPGWLTRATASLSRCYFELMKKEHLPWRWYLNSRRGTWLRRAGRSGANRA
jgi:hypothetical protein